MSCFINLLGIVVEQPGKQGIGSLPQISGACSRDERQTVNMLECTDLHGADERDHSIDQQIPVSRGDERNGQQYDDLQEKHKLFP